MVILGLRDYFERMVMAIKYSYGAQVVDIKVFDLFNIVEALGEVILVHFPGYMTSNLNRL